MSKMKGVEDELFLLTFSTRSLTFCFSFEVFVTLNPI